MDTQLRQTTVEDLLHYCRDNGHALNTGRMLAPILLGRPWNGEDDDGHLGIAMERLVADALAQRRRTLGIPAIHPSTPAATWLKDAANQGDQPLLQFSFVQAYYIEQLETKRIGDWCKLSERSVQLKIQDGRLTLAKLIAKHEHVAQHDPVAAAHTNGQAPPIDAATEADSVAAPTSRPAMPNTSPTDAAKRGAQHTTTRVEGHNVQSVSAPVTGWVVQNQHIYHGDASGKPSSTSAQGEDGLMLGLGLVLLAGGYWLLQTAPWLSIGTLLALSLWRGITHILRAWHMLADTWDADERWWQVGYAALWLAAVVWAVVLAVRMRSNVQTAVGFDQLWSVVWFVGLIGQLCMLGIIDLYLAVLRSPAPRWPLRMLAPRAAWFWTQRWLMLFVAWLPLVVVMVTTFMAKF